MEDSILVNWLVDIALTHGETEALMVMAAIAGCIMAVITYPLVYMGKVR